MTETGTTPAGTPEDAQAIAAAGSAAAVQHPTDPAASQAAAEAAMKAEAAKRQVELPPEQIEMIAAATIKMLEARGAFEDPTPAASGNSGSTESTPAAPSSPSGTEALSQPPPASPPVPPTPDDEPPRKRTFAERFQGKN